MNFASDNGAGVAREILEAIAASSRVNAPAYGADDYTARAEAMLAEVFETEISAYLVATGTAANALALSALAQPWDAVFCHEEAHVHDDECGAPEFFTGGAKLVGILGEGGKITPAGMRETLSRFPRGLVKGCQPGALSLSQATEAGTVYSEGEIAALCDVAHAAGVRVHIDGARFANALVASALSPADLTWRAGVDALSFGATKNGALACEAVVFFDPARAADFAYRRSAPVTRCPKGAFWARRWWPTSRTTSGFGSPSAPMAQRAASAKGSPRRLEYGWPGRRTPTRSSSLRRPRPLRRGGRTAHGSTIGAPAPSRLSGRQVKGKR